MSTSIKRSPIAGLPQPRIGAVSGQDAVSSSPIRLDLMRGLRRRPRLGAGVAAAVFSLIVWFGLSRSPMYQAESLTYIEPLASKVLSDGATSGTYDSSRYDSYLQQQMQTAIRPDILAAAIEKLPPNVWQHPGEKMQSAVSRLQGALTVERVTTSYQLAITLADANPETAASVVNAVTNTYLEQGRKDEHAAIDQRLQLLGEERQRIQQMLDEDRLEQASLGKALGVANASGLVGSQYDAQIAGVQTQIAGAREAKDIAAAQLASLPGQGEALSPGLAAAAEDLINTDAGLNSMKATITARKAVLSTQMAGLTPSNPLYKQDQAEITDLDRSLDAMTSDLRVKTARRLQDKMRADLQRTADVEGRLDAQLQHQTATATSAAPKVQRLAELTADMQRLDARYGVVDDAMRGLQLESNGPGSAHLSVAAAVPVSPEPSKRKLILLLALPLALLSGLAAVFLAGRLDPRIYSGSDVAQVLGFLPIGVMPAHAEVSSRVMEEYTLRLAAGLQSAYRSSGAQSFVFTSTSPTIQIGSFVRAIEVVLSSLGFKAVVMDASSVLHAAGRNQATSRGSSQPQPSVIMRTIEGVRQGHAAEEMERLKLKYDLLLIEAPPLLQSAETEYLARCADATILIAESGVTVKPELFQSALLLQHLNVAGVGAVLQELHLKDADASFRSAIAAAERASDPMLEEPAQVDSERTSSQHAVAEPVQTDKPGPVGQSAVVVDAARDASLVEHNQGKEAAQAKDVVDDRSTAPDVEPADQVEVTRFSSAVEAVTTAPVAASSEAKVAADRVEVEERDQVRIWDQLMKRRQAEPPEEELLRAPDEPLASTSPSPVEEPVIYFQDRLRLRSPLESAAPHSRASKASAEGPDAVVEPAPATFSSDSPTSSAGIEAADEAAHQAVSRHRADPVIRPFVSHLESEDESQPSASEPIYAETLHPALLQQERSVLESGTESLLTPHHEELPLPTVAPEPMSAAEVVVGPDAQEQVPRGEKTWSSARVQQTMEAFTAGHNKAPENDAVPTLEADPPTGAVVRDAGEAEREATASASEVPPKREAAPARMEWFTLRFRGTSERVLRLVPGEEGEGVTDQDQAAAAVEEHATWSTFPTGNEGFAQTASRPEGQVEEDHAAEGEIEIERSRLKPATARTDDSPRPAAAMSESALYSEEEAATAESEYATETGASVPPAEIQDEQPAVGLTAAREAARPHFIDLEASLADGSVVELPPVSAVPPVAQVPVAVPAPERTKINRWAVHDDTPGGIGKTPAGLDHEVSDESSVEAILSAAPELPVRLRVDEAVVASVDRFAPALLVGELCRHSSLGSEQLTASPPARSWNRRSVSAPVEERLEPKAPSLTRRWQMLSRFDQPVTAAEGSAEMLPSGSAAMDQSER